MKTNLHKKRLKKLILKKKINRPHQCLEIYLVIYQKIKHYSMIIFQQFHKRKTTKKSYFLVVLWTIKMEKKKMKNKKQRIYLVEVYFQIEVNNQSHYLI